MYYIRNCLNFIEGICSCEGYVEELKWVMEGVDGSVMKELKVVKDLIWGIRFRLM